MNEKGDIKSNEQFYTKDRGFDNQLRDILFAINAWAETYKVYSADVKFHINKFRVEHTDVSRNYKHFYESKKGHEGPHEN